MEEGNNAAKVFLYLFMEEVYAQLVDKGIWNYGIIIAKRKHINHANYPLSKYYSSGAWYTYPHGKQVGVIQLLTSLN